MVSVFFYFQFFQREKDPCLHWKDTKRFGRVCFFYRYCYCLCSNELIFNILSLPNLLWWTTAQILLVHLFIEHVRWRLTLKGFPHWYFWIFPPYLQQKCHRPMKFFIRNSLSQILKTPNLILFYLLFANVGWNHCSPIYIYI